MNADDLSQLYTAVLDDDVIEELLKRIEADTEVKSIAAAEATGRPQDQPMLRVVLMIVMHGRLSRWLDVMHSGLEEAGTDQCREIAELISEYRQSA